MREARTKFFGFTHSIVIVALAVFPLSSDASL